MASSQSLFFSKEPSSYKSSKSSQAPKKSKTDEVLGEYKHIAEGPMPLVAPKTAFMCFMDAKQKKEMKENCTKGTMSSDNIRRVAYEWKHLSPEIRAYWDEEARKDKIRFMEEKRTYRGPWELPKRRAKKHPLAPKRPMSAFLKYSQTRRKLVKDQNPHMSNTDVSRVLGEMWRCAKYSERRPYIEEEATERSHYKAAIAVFRSEQARREAFIKLEFDVDRIIPLDHNDFDEIECASVEIFDSQERTPRSHSFVQDYHNIKPVEFEPPLNKIPAPLSSPYRNRWHNIQQAQSDSYAVHPHDRYQYHSDISDPVEHSHGTICSESMLKTKNNVRSSVKEGIKRQGHFR